MIVRSPSPTTTLFALMRGRELKSHQTRLLIDAHHVRPHARAGVEMSATNAATPSSAFALMRGRELKC